MTTAAAGPAAVKKKRRKRTLSKPPAPECSPVAVSVEGACAALGGISRTQLNRLIVTGRLPVIRLPGRRDAHGQGTTDSIRRVLFAVEDLQQLVRESREPVPSNPALLRLRKRGAA